MNDDVPKKNHITMDNKQLTLRENNIKKEKFNKKLNFYPLQTLNSSITNKNDKKFQIPSLRNSLKENNTFKRISIKTFTKTSTSTTVTNKKVVFKSPIEEVILVNSNYKQILRKLNNSSGRFLSDDNNEKEVFKCGCNIF